MDGWTEGRNPPGWLSLGWRWECACPESEVSLSDGDTAAEIKADPHLIPRPLAAGAGRKWQGSGREGGNAQSHQQQSLLESASPGFAPLGLHREGLGLGKTGGNKEKVQ